MRRLIDQLLGRPRHDRPAETDQPFRSRSPRDDRWDRTMAEPLTQLFGNGLNCPACGSVRTATLSILRPEPPGHWTAQRRCRACGHDWEEDPTEGSTEPATLPGQPAGS
jgi:hypothetical protein